MHMIEWFYYATGWDINRQKIWTHLDRAGQGSLEAGQGCLIDTITYHEHSEQELIIDRPPSNVLGAARAHLAIAIDQRAAGRRRTRPGRHPPDPLENQF